MTEPKDGKHVDLLVPVVVAMQRFVRKKMVRSLALTTRIGIHQVATLRVKPKFAGIIPHPHKLKAKDRRISWGIGTPVMDMQIVDGVAVDTTLYRPAGGVYANEQRQSFHVESIRSLADVVHNGGSFSEMKVGAKRAQSMGRSSFDQALEACVEDSKEQKSADDPSRSSGPADAVRAKSLQHPGVAEPTESPDIRLIDASSDSNG